MKEFVAALRKEMLLQWSGRSQVLATLTFGASTLLLFSFAIGPDATALRQHSSGFLWLGLLLASTLTLSETFHSEMEDRALEGMLLMPVAPHIIFYAKAVANCLQLTVLGIALMPVMIVLYDAGSNAPGALVLIIFLGAAGLAAPGTIYSAMAARTRAKQTLLPLLLFPLVVPVLLAAVKASSLSIGGDPMGQRQSWLTLLACFDAIYWSLCGLLFGRVVED